MYDTLMGENGPLYWIAIYFLFLALVPMMLLFAQVASEYNCKMWVGESYIYHNSRCYRVADNQMIYVDVRLEKKLSELSERELE